MTTYTAEAWRVQVEQVRELAARMKNEDDKRALLEIAEQCEEWASELENRTE